MSGNHENNLSKEMLDISSRAPRDVDVVTKHPELKPGASCLDKEFENPWRGSRRPVEA